MEAIMQETWGDRYINLRAMLSDREILEDAGVELQESDLEEMAEGIVPQAVRTDGVHYTEIGYAILADAVYHRLNELGYLDDVNEVASKYTRRWTWLQMVKGIF